MKNFIKTTIKEFLNENINSKFIVGKLYEYSELNSEIQKDIDKQFKKNSLEDDEDPYMDYPHYQQPLFDGDQDDYLYCFDSMLYNKIITL